MAPNVPDLPRREQRRGTRMAMMWGAGAAIVLFAAVLIWAFVTAPNGQLGGTTRQRPSPTTGVLANQGAGESQAGKDQAVTPRQKSGRRIRADFERRGGTDRAKRDAIAAYGCAVRANPDLLLR